jgi:hypothetical protein
MREGESNVRNTKKMKVCSIVKGLPQLIMALRGNVAAEFRQKMGEVSSRVMDGDKTVISEVICNGSLDLPLDTIIPTEHILPNADVGDEIVELMKNVELSKPTAFSIDNCGNKIIPASVFRGEINVRATTTKSGMVVIDVVQAIMAVTGKNRHYSNKVWSNIEDDVKSSIIADLKGDEGTLSYIYISSWVTNRDRPFFGRSQKCHPGSQIVTDLFLVGHKNVILGHKI